MLGIGLRIKEARKKANLNQEELAEKTKTARQTISSWENGKFLPEMSNIQKLAAVLGTSVSYLIGEGKSDILPIKVEMHHANQSVGFGIGKQHIVNGDIVKESPILLAARTIDALENVRDCDLVAIKALLERGLKTVEEKLKMSSE